MWEGEDRMVLPEGLRPHPQPTLPESACGQDAGPSVCRVKTGSSQEVVPASGRQLAEQGKQDVVRSL